MDMPAESKLPTRHPRRTDRLQFDGRPTDSTAPQRPSDQPEAIVLPAEWHVVLAG